MQHQHQHQLFNYNLPDLVDIENKSPSVVKQYNNDENPNKAVFCGGLMV